MCTVFEICIIYAKSYVHAVITLSVSSAEPTSLESPSGVQECNNSRFSKEPTRTVTESPSGVQESDHSHLSVLKEPTEIDPECGDHQSKVHVRSSLILLRMKVSESPNVLYIKILAYTFN